MLPFCSGTKKEKVGNGLEIMQSEIPIPKNRDLWEKNNIDNTVLITLRKHFVSRVSSFPNMRPLSYPTFIKYMKMYIR